MGMYTEAVIDSDTSQLVRNEGFRVLQTNQVDEATVYDCNVETGEYSVLPQPFNSDSSGNVRFWANPGLYYLTRGGTPSLIEVFGNVLFPDPENTTVYLTNESTEYSPNGNAVIFNRAYRPVTVLGGDLTISETFPPPGEFYYSGSSDITVTISTSFCTTNTTWTFYQLGTGKITISVTTGTMVNYYGHTKTAGLGAVALLTQVGGPTTDEGLKYSWAGITA